jgi:hypothetical protein
VTDDLRPRPAHTCRQLLAALEASEGRRRRRKRNTTPDAIGMAIKRRLLEETVREDSSEASGPARAMALEVLAEWQLAERSQAFRSWLQGGAESEDRR